MAACAFVVCCSLAVPARADGGDLEVRLAWPDGLAVRCGIPIGASRLVLIGDGGTGGSIALAAGLDGPLVRAGPLVPAGLLREIAKPLGFGPGTDVGTQTTGLRLSAPLGARAEASVQVALIPEVLAVFWLRPAEEAGASGGFLGGALGPARLGPVLLEAAAALGGPGPSEEGEEWIRGGPPHPPGLVLQGAARIRLALPCASAAVSGGLSAAERAPPGWFAIGTASLGRGDIGVDLLAAAASSGYLELGGGDDPGGMRAGLRLRLAGRSGRLVARYVVSADLPGFVPGPWLGTGEEIDIALERWRATVAGTWEAGLCASNRIATDANGGRQDDPAGRVSAGWNGDRFRAGLAVDIGRDDGISVEGALGTGKLLTCATAALESGCTFRDGAACLRLSGRAGLERGSWEATVRAGIDDAPLVRGGLRDARPWISLGWRVTASADPQPEDRAP